MRQRRNTNKPLNRFGKALHYTSNQTYVFNVIVTYIQSWTHTHFSRVPFIMAYLWPLLVVVVSAAIPPRLAPPLLVLVKAGHRSSKTFQQVDGKTCERKRLKTEEKCNFLQEFSQYFQQQVSNPDFHQTTTIMPCPPLLFRASFSYAATMVSLTI